MNDPRVDFWSSFLKTSFWSIFCFSYQIFVNFWRQKNPNSKMVHRRKISTTEVRGNKRFFYTQSGVRFWFRPLFGKMIAAPPGCSTFRAKIFIWANSVIIHSLKNMFKVPGGIRWQFFPFQMRSVCWFDTNTKDLPETSEMGVADP